MRIRQIKPDYWLDKTLQRRLTAEQREVYVGLWMLADDAGWLVWDVETIAAQLRPYDAPARRERLVTSAAERLRTIDPQDPHLLVLDCGHARVPKLVRHQRFGGRPVFTVRDAHARDCAQMRADDRASSPMLDDARDDARASADAPNGRVRVGNGRVGNGRVTPPLSKSLSPPGQDDYGREVARKLAQRLGVEAD